jgi:hypothetical protein
MTNATHQPIIISAIKVIGNPANFYRKMEKSGGFLDPVVFIIAMAVLTELIPLILPLVSTNTLASTVIKFEVIATFSILAVVKSFIGAAILLVIWKLLGASEHYETAYRCVAYASAIMPITTALCLTLDIGSTIGIIWLVYLLYIASIETLASSYKWPGRYRYI